MLKPSSCHKCVIGNISEGFSAVEGKGTNGVLIIGDYISYSDLHDGLPFRPWSEGGSKLEEAFRTLGVSRQQFLLTNLLKCVPTRGKLYDSWFANQAISYCHKEHTEPILELFGDSISTILTLGPDAFKFFTGMSGIAKEKESLDDVRGFVHSWQGKKVVCTYHPKYIRNGQEHLTPILIEDIKKAIAVAKGEFTNFPGGSGYIKPDYNEYPSMEDCYSFYHHVKDNSNLFLSYDIETAIKEDVSEEQRNKKDLLAQNSRPILVQFSYKKGMGIALPFTCDYYEPIRKLFALPNQKGNHNTWSFDNPLLERFGIAIPGQTHDTMWMFKHYYPFLPRGLQNVASLMGFPFPWKHFYGEKLRWYGCADVDAVQYIIARLPKLMKEAKVWKGYYDYVYSVKPILDVASQTGMPVVEEKRLALDGELKQEVKLLIRKIHKELPLKLRNVQPRRKDKKTGKVEFGYKREPKIVTQTIATWNKNVPQLAKLEKQGKKLKYADGYQFVYAKTKMVLKKFHTITEEGERKVEERWCKILPFKASKDQLVKYIRYKASVQKRQADKHLYRLPVMRGKKDKEGNAKTTTNANALIEIVERTGDPLLAAVVELRSLKKIITNDLVNWKPDENNLVHTEWGYKSPTGQFDSRMPNIQNASKHSSVGKRFRGIIIAPSGKVLIELDYKAFHVAMMGYLANSKNYIRFSQLDPHSIFGSWVELPDVTPISFDWSDQDIMEACREFKKKYPQVRQGACKPCVLGNQLGLGPFKLWNQNKKSIHDIDHAEYLQKKLNEPFPEVVRFKEKLLEEVHVTRRYVTKFGRQAQFYSVFSFKWDVQRKAWDRKHGTDTEKVYAQAVQGNAFGMITQLGILNPAKEDLHRRYGFCNTIHDSIVLMCDAREKDKAIESYYRHMTAPCIQLVNEACPQGLRVNVEVSIGECFRDLKEITI